MHHTQACGQRALSGSMGMSLLFLETELFIVLSLTELSCSHADLAMNVVHAYLAALRSNGFDEKLHRPPGRMAPFVEYL